MKNVVRPPEPQSLVENSLGWTQELLKAIKKSKRDGGKLRKTLSTRYDKPDVKDALSKMYGGYCCYCEAEVGVVAYEHIEHRKPKAIDKFPELTFVWSNLHLACPRCNGKKSDQWNDKAEILDSVVDAPIGQHLTYKSGLTGVRRWPLTGRGRTTVNHADLNREKLRNSRTYVYLDAMETVRDIKTSLDADPEDPQAHAALAELQDLYTGPFGSLIRYTVETWL